MAPPSRQATQPPASNRAREQTPLFRQPSVSFEPTPRNAAPLFRPPSPSQELDLPAVNDLPVVAGNPGEMEVDEFDDEFGQEVIPDSELDAAWETLSQMPPSTLPPVPQGSAGSNQEVHVIKDTGSDSEDEEDLNPKKAKKAKWQIFS